MFEKYRELIVISAAIALLATMFTAEGQIITASQHLHVFPVSQLSTDNIHSSLKSVALSSTTTQAPNLTAIFKLVENSVVQITASTPNPNLQIIINGKPFGGQST